jgi:hypothetical protein
MDRHLQYKLYLYWYKKGEIVSGISKDADGNKYTYTSLETKPEPIKGINDFFITYW